MHVLKTRILPLLTNQSVDLASISTREGEPFTAVVDGANVAYFGFPDLHYSQVKLVVDELRRIGENPLVVLPKKYTYPTFMLSTTSNAQILTDRDASVIKRYVVFGH